jgi:hypothetical protein
MVVATGTATTLLGGVTLAAGNVDQFTVAIDPDTTNEEIVFITAVSGDTFTIVRARAGTTGITHASGATVRHVLTSDDLNFFKTAIQPSTLTTKGDMYVATAASTVTRLGAGTNDYALVSDSTQTAGLKYQNLSSRTETLTNKTIDYNSNTITNLPSTSLNLTLNAQTGTTYTLLSTDVNKLVTLSNASAVTVTVPNGVFTVGQQVHMQAIGAGQVTVASDGTTTITSTPGLKLRAQYSAATLVCTGTNTFTLIGDLSA